MQNAWNNYSLTCGEQRWKRLQSKLALKNKFLISRYGNEETLFDFFDCVRCITRRLRRAIEMIDGRCETTIALAKCARRRAAQCLWLTEVKGHVTPQNWRSDKCQIAAHWEREYDRQTQTDRQINVASQSTDSVLSSFVSQLYNHHFSCRHGAYKTSHG